MTLSPMKEPESMQGTVMRDEGKAGKRTSQQHHSQAAESHEKAAQHHRDAAKLDEAGDPQGAAHSAHIAHGYSVSAMEHAAGASKEYGAACRDAVKASGSSSCRRYDHRHCSSSEVQVVHLPTDRVRTGPTKSRGANSTTSARQLSMNGSKPGSVYPRSGISRGGSSSQPDPGERLINRMRAAHT